MSAVTRIVLDVLKPHVPNILDFAKSIGDLDSTCDVQVMVEELDEKTESIMVIIEGSDIDYEKILGVINEKGGSVHSIDEVAITGRAGS